MERDSAIISRSNAFGLRLQMAMYTAQTVLKYKNDK